MLLTNLNFPWSEFEGINVKLQHNISSFPAFYSVWHHFRSPRSRNWRPCVITPRQGRFMMYAASKSPAQIQNAITTAQKLIFIILDFAEMHFCDALVARLYAAIMSFLHRGNSRCVVSRSTLNCPHDNSSIAPICRL